ncbi:MAG: methyl-accepting chemotaxis protein [Deferrisomatales bacterium]
MGMATQGGGAGVWSLAAAAAGGLGAWGLAAAGQAGFGAVVLGAGLAAAAAVRRLGPDPAVAGPGSDVPELLGRVEGRGQAIRDVTRGLQEHATLLAWVVDSLGQTTAEVRSGIESFREAMGRVEGHAGEVLRSSQRGTEFIEAMGQSTEELFQGADTLNRAVEDATASMVQIHAAMSGVEQGVALLSATSDRTTEFISQVGQAMGAIRARTDQSLQVSRKVEAYARRGREVVVQVGQGVDAIRRASEGMVGSVQALSHQSREIEGVLGIITDVAQETGLLSLNAAILAAQAGEKGAAFGVVADQIRSLAQRTRDSTKHIEELVRGIQTNIAEANRGLAANLGAVQEGEALGREAVQQLELIEGAVGESLAQASQVVKAAEDQDEKSRAMVSAAGEVNQSLHGVAENLGQSLREMDRIQALIQSLAALSESVRGAAEAHRHTGWKTAELMESFAVQVQGIHGLVGEQRGTSGRLEAALDQVAESSSSTRESLETIHGVVKELVGQSDGLRQDVGALRGREEDGTDGTA